MSLGRLGEQMLWRQNVKKWHLAAEVCHFTVAVDALYAFLCVKMALGADFVAIYVILALFACLWGGLGSRF